jgi:hypothetical protein
MIVGICSAKEEPWIDEPIRHLLAQGADRIIVSVPLADDATANVVHNAGGRVVSQLGPFKQDEEMTRLAHLAVSDLDATWIVPFDADEFWIDPTRAGIVADVLHAQLPHVTRIYAAMFTMLTVNQKCTDQKPFGKVAFRPHPDMKLYWGQHDIYLPDGIAEHGLLEVRELQYRDRAHWDAKIDKARRLFDTGAVPSEFGGHMRALVNASPEELDTLWRIYQDTPTVTDPIGL